MQWNVDETFLCFVLRVWAIGKCIKLIRFWSDLRIGGCRNKLCKIIKFPCYQTSVRSLQNQSGGFLVGSLTIRICNQGQDQDVHI